MGFNEATGKRFPKTKGGGPENKVATPGRKEVRKIADEFQARAYPGRPLQDANENVTIPRPATPTAARTTGGHGGTNTSITVARSAAVHVPKKTGVTRLLSRNSCSPENYHKGGVRRAFHP